MVEYYGNHNTSKQNDVDTLQATEWNNLAGDVNKLVQAINNNEEDIISTQVDPTDSNKTFVKISDITVGELTNKGDKGTNVSLSGNNNINIEPRPAAGTGEGKNTPGLVNRKGGNIAFKPGDDIEFWAHKRGTSKNDEVSVKIMTEVPKASDPTKTDEVAAKLQLNTADMVLTSKDKQEDLDVMNITINRDTNTRGYLKVRALAIDLRCEEHGGIALLPKGTDGQGNENKIKFEHGGGDGLEFATFNSEKTSIFTDEYRFNRDGIWKMATRSKVVSDKYNNNDETTHYKYVKLNDDFYDNIYNNDPTVTTKDIIDTTFALNGKYGANTYVDNGWLYINCDPKFKCEIDTNPDIYSEELAEITPLEVSNINYFVNNNYYLRDQIGAEIDYYENEPSEVEELLPSLVNTYKHILIYPQGMSLTADVIDLKFTKMPSVTDVYFNVNGEGCRLTELIQLVNYFKTNHEGPWTN